MKSTGVVRKVDELGRIVLPSEMRESMDINKRDAMEIFTDGDRIILQKYSPFCIFCSNGGEMIHFQGKRICTACLEKLKTEC